MMSRSAKKEKIDLLTTDLHYRVLVGETVLRFSFTKDLLLEDEPARDKGKPFPLGNISAQVSEIEASINEKDRIIVQGSLEGRAFFYGSQGIKELTWQEDEFYREADFRGALPGMEATAHGRVSFLGQEGAPLEAEGKLLYQLQIEVEVFLAVVDPQQLEVAVGVKDIPPERVSRDILTVEELVSEKTLDYTLTQEEEFAEDLNFIKIINSYLQGFAYDWGKEEIILRGELVTSIYVMAGGKGRIQENRQQFNQPVPFPKQKKELQISLFPGVREAICVAAGKKARYDVTVEVFFRTTRVVQQEVVSDIQGIDVKKEYLLLPKSVGMAKEPLELVQKLSVPFPREIAAGFCHLLNMEVNAQEDRISMAGSLEKDVYYLPAVEEEFGVEEELEEAGLPFVLKVNDDFLSDYYLPGVSPDAEVVAYFQSQGTEYAPTENDTLQISHALLEIKAWETQEVAVVVPYRVPPGTSMVIYAARYGDTLLKIGRAYGLRAQVIAAANGLDEDAALEAGQKLLLPLMFGDSVST
jgi:LysM repeat protein